jgi:alanine dehydrogenase
MSPREHVAEGAFVAAVGADHPEKQEIEPELLAASAVVVDVLEQCATIGDLHHAIASGLMRRGDVRAELAEVVSGQKAGRLLAEEIVVFDSTGTALQDVAAASLAFERALATGAGLTVQLGAA